MNDIDAKIADVKKKAEAATPGPWEDDSIRNEGDYGSGEDTRSKFHSYAVYADGKAICDTLNSDLALVEEEYDEDGASAWDEVGRKNMAYISAASPDLIIAWAEERERDKARIAELEKDRDELALALVMHNDALRSAKAISSRYGESTNWHGFHNQVTYCLEEGHAASNMARNLVNKSSEAENASRTLKEKP